MLRFYLKELLAEREFKEQRVITIIEVANAIGINRMTLSKIANNNKNANPTFSIIDLLCTYFDCQIERLVLHIPDKAPPT